MQFGSDGLVLEGHLARPDRIPTAGAPGFVICHGFPTAAIGAARSGQSYHSLADRIAEGKGAVVLAMHYRGCGGSEGNFSLTGWLSDVENAIDALSERDDVSSVSVIGFGTGAALGICAAASRPAVRAVAAVAPPADFSDWSNDPELLLEHALQVGAISDPGFPEDFERWSAELTEVQAVIGAGELAPRPLLILHGADDDLVPIFDSRIVADAHGSAELRIIHGAGHLLRYDPRAIAVLLGWVDRLRYNTSMV
ncbi:MAG: alpha/beta fold hydrolase [Actinomycetota bacterium]